MKERPILFSAPMVRAILEGRKTQTRRIVKFGACLKPNVRAFMRETIEAAKSPDDMAMMANYIANAYTCRYGVPGDRLWVRETLYLDADRGWQYADTSPLRCEHDRIGEMTHWLNNRRAKQRACVSIHMPRWASRITLEVVSVRVERLQEISDGDARAEGVPTPEAHEWTISDKDLYARLWESINGPGSWAANPWVWVVEFKRLEAQ